MTPEEIERESIKFKIEIIKIIKSYTTKCLQISNYRLYNAYTDEIINNLKEDHLTEALKSNFNEIESFKSTREEMKNQSKSYTIINNDLVYKLHFQFFEEFLSEIVYFCLKTFPQFLYNVDQKNDLPYDRIFDNNSSIESIQDYVISSKVKNIIQSNNIIDIILKIEKLFSIKFNISRETLDTLFISSANRNIMTHNNGIVNEVYLGLMKSRKIKTNLIKGNSIFQNLGQDLGRNNQETIADIIVESFVRDSKRLIMHHNTLT